MTDAERERARAEWDPDDALDMKRDRLTEGAHLTERDEAGMVHGRPMVALLLEG